nr:MAG: hypothetical protein [Parvoviridae sp.]
MTTPNSQPVDSVQGNLSSKGQPTRINRSLGKTSYTRTFKRTYIHYISNDGAQPAHAPINWHNGTADDVCDQSMEGLVAIPYDNVGVAIPPSSYATMLTDIGRVQVLSLGYTCKRITTLQENLVSRASSTIMENVFESKPYLMRYIDYEHMLDNYVGRTVYPSAEQNGVLMAQQQHASSNRVTPYRPSFAYGNNAFLDPYPNTQVDGSLDKTAWYIQQCNYPPPLDPLVPHPLVRPGGFIALDLFDTDIITENDTFGHTWHNPSPQWHSTCTQPMTYRLVTDPTPPTGAIRESWIHAFPSTRVEALTHAYRATLQDDNQDVNTDQIESLYSAQPGIASTDNDNPPFNTCSSDFRPPVNYLKMPPIKGPTGDLSLVAQLIVEYTCTLKFERASFGTRPQLFVLADNDDNKTMIRPQWSLYDPHHTYGARSTPYQLLRTSGDDVNLTDGFRVPAQVTSRKRRSSPPRHLQHGWMGSDRTSPPSDD